MISNIVMNHRGEEYFYSIDDGGVWVNLSNDSFATKEVGSVLMRSALEKGIAPSMFSQEDDSSMVGISLDNSTGKIKNI